MIRKPSRYYQAKRAMQQALQPSEDMAQAAMEFDTLSRCHWCYYHSKDVKTFYTWGEKVNTTPFSDASYDRIKATHLSRFPWSPVASWGNGVVVGYYEYIKLGFRPDAGERAERDAFLSEWRSMMS